MSPRQSKADPSWHRAAWFAGVAALAIAAAAATCTCVYNHDIFWHLASGEWMIQNGRVLHFDPFSVDPLARWVNVHWLFQVVVALLHGVGGFAALTIMKSALAVACVLVFAVGMRRHIRPGWLIFGGLITIAIIARRVRVRPECVTLALLMLTIVLIEQVRRGASARRLWWLVAIQLLWVNMHGLFILGLAVIWAAMLGALLDRLLNRGGLSSRLLTGRVLAPVMSATVVCLVSPWPIEAALHPFLLLTRVWSVGQHVYYQQVTELHPTTWQVLWHRPEVVVAALVTVILILANLRRVPAGHLLWLAGFGALAALALRNMGLLGPVCGYLIALNGHEITARLLARRPAAARAGPALTVLLLLASAALTFGCATEWIYQKLGRPWRFGLGLQREVYALDTARFLAELPATGAVLCENFGDSAVFIYAFNHNRVKPVRRVWMDGRLEAHSLERFIRQDEIRQDLTDNPDNVKLPESVKFVVVRHSSPTRLKALAKSDRFDLIYVGEASACFWPRPPGSSRPPCRPNLDDYDHPLTGDRTVRGTTPARRRWYRRNPYSRNLRLGAMLLPLGNSRRPRERRCTVLALRYLTAAVAEGVAPRNVALGTLARAYQQQVLYNDLLPNPALPVSIHTACEMRLYSRLDLTDLGKGNMQLIAMQRICGLIQSRQIDTAGAAMESFLANLPVKLRMKLPSSIRDVRHKIADSLRAARRRIDPEELQKMSLARRVALMTAPDVGLVNMAVEELLGARRDDAARLKLGDLLLGQGRAAEARRAYGEVSSSAANARRLELRGALCDWTEGRLFAAVGALDRLPAGADDPSVRYYQAALLELLGRYGQARAAATAGLGRARDAQLKRLLGRIEQRIKAQ